MFCFVSEQEKTTPPGSTENIVEEIGELGQTVRLWLEESSPVQAFAFATSTRSDGENTPGFAISCVNICTPSQIFRFLFSYHPGSGCECCVLSARQVGIFLQLVFEGKQTYVEIKTRAVFGHWFHEAICPETILLNTVALPTEP